MDTFLSWSKNFVTWLWSKGWRGKLAAGVIVLVAASGIWGIPKLLAAPAIVVPTPPIPEATGSKSSLDVTKGMPLDGALPQIKGLVSSYSPEGWPRIEKTTVRLSGVRLIVASRHDRFAAWITSHGGYLECDSSNGGNTYRCLTAQRLDVAQTVLLNGAAQATCDADPVYRAAEETGKRITGGRSVTSAIHCP